MNKKIVLFLGLTILIAAGAYVFFSEEPGSQMSVSSADEAQKKDQASHRPARREKLADCGSHLELYSGPQLLWRRDAEEVAAMPESEALEKSHQKGAQGLSLLSLAAMVPDATTIEVVTCDGKVARLPVDKVQGDSERFYIGANRRGAFKLIEFFDGAEHTAMRNIGQVILKPGGQRRISEEPDPT